MIADVTGACDIKEKLGVLAWNNNWGVQQELRNWNRNSSYSEGGCMQNYYSKFILENQLRKIHKECDSSLDWNGISLSASKRDTQARRNLLATNEMSVEAHRGMPRAASALALLKLHCKQRVGGGACITRCKSKCAVCMIRTQRALCLETIQKPPASSHGIPQRGTR